MFVFSSKDVVTIFNIRRILPERTAKPRTVSKENGGIVVFKSKVEKNESVPVFKEKELRLHLIKQIFYAMKSNEQNIEVCLMQLARRLLSTCSTVVTYTCFKKSNLDWH